MSSLSASTVRNGESSFSGAPRGTLRIHHIIAITYALTSGGPFGIESCVRTMGPAWCMVGLLCTLLFYSFPEIAMNLDLMMVRPVCNGGVVTWAERGLGKPAAALVALNMLAYGLLDLATYPTLVAGYFKDVDEGHAWLASASCYSVVVVGGALNLLNLEYATGIYMVMLVASLLPFAVGVVLASSSWRVAVSALSMPPSTSGPVSAAEFNLFLSTMLWLSTGWDCVGNVAMEASSPRCLVHGLCVAAVLGFLTYAICALGALAAGPGDWDDGYLAIAYGRFWAPLEDIIVVMGAVSQFLMFASSLTCVARLIQAMADPDLGLRLLPTPLAKRLPSTGAPVTAILAISAIELSLVSGLTFDYVLQVSTLLHVFVFWASLASFISIRFRQNAVDRLWGLPGGRCGAAAVACMRVLVLTLMVICACGVPSVLVGAIAGNFFFVLLAVGWAWYRGGLSMRALHELDTSALASLEAS